LCIFERKTRMNNVSFSLYWVMFWNYVIIDKAVTSCVCLRKNCQVSNLNPERLNNKELYKIA
jgi:hypothetical protein